MITQIFLISLGLTMDTFAIGVAAGVSLQSRHIAYGARFGIIAAIVQMFMVLLGWGVGRSIVRFLGFFDRWIAFIVLCLLGIKMIRQSIEIKEVEEKIAHLGIRALIVLAIATSIDALAVGFGLSFVGLDIMLLTIMIGGLTFLMGIFGIMIGEKVGDVLGKRGEVLGGIILMLIGLKILTEHIF